MEGLVGEKVHPVLDIFNLFCIFNSAFGAWYRVTFKYFRHDCIAIVYCPNMAQDDRNQKQVDVFASAKPSSY